MAYYHGGRRTGPSVLETFSLYPVPYPVLVILAVVMLLLGVSSFLSYEDVVEGAEEQLNWVLLAAPLLLVLAIRWLSAIESPGLPFGLSPYERRRGYWYGGGGGGGAAQEGSSPWGVLALVVLLLVLVSFQSSFREMWLI